jgi:hypothetical protein
MQTYSAIIKDKTTTLKAHFNFNIAISDLFELILLVPLTSPSVALHAKPFDLPSNSTE